MNRSGKIRVPADPEEHLVYEDEPTPGFVVEWKANEHILDFVVNEVTEDSRGETVVQQVAEGHLKWYGCLNIRFVSTEYFRFCGPEEDPILGRLMKAIYQLGKNITAWDFDGAYQRRLRGIPR